MWAAVDLCVRLGRRSRQERAPLENAESARVYDRGVKDSVGELLLSWRCPPVVENYRLPQLKAR